MIEVTSWADEQSRGSRGCFWIAETVLADGRAFSARSQHGAPNDLARQLVAAGVPDDEMQVYDRRRAMIALRYRSFHEVAKWSYTEGNRPLQRVRYQESPFAAGPRTPGDPE